MTIADNPYLWIWPSYEITIFPPSFVDGERCFVQPFANWFNGITGILFKHMARSRFGPFAVDAAFPIDDVLREANQACAVVALSYAMTGRIPSPPGAWRGVPKF